MRVHRNAKTTLRMRQLIVTRAQQGWTYAQIGEALGISVRTVAKWIARSRQANGLVDGSSRPQRQPRRTAPALERAIVVLRRRRLTAWQISTALRQPRSTVTRVLARVGLNRIAWLDPVPPVQRYEWPHTGDLLHIDLKRLGRVVGIGHRIHGDRRRRARKAGFEYLHVAIDDASRLTYAEVLAADDAPACAAFLQRTLTWFRRRGIGIRRLLTDNALAYKAGVFAAVCRRWEVRQRFTRPYRPQTNGKAERFIQTLLREWAYRTPYRSSARRTAALRPYLRFYNHRRPHTSLGRRSPWMRFQEAA
ncbi:MAG TPA: IS481 family transposase [Burkholderiales bacterium]|jgi:transposase InsO family protein|nr:IS481 family transposase [Burkholderiales bacterium]